MDKGDQLEGSCNTLVEMMIIWTNILTEELADSGSVSTGVTIEFASVW